MKHILKTKVIVIDDYCLFIIIHFQFYYISAIAALNEGAHAVFRNMVNLVNNIQLILITLWVSSPSKSSVYISL